MSNMNVLMTNTSAMFTDRQIGITTRNKAKTAEKLSSGFRINRAADDAAGLTISEKMRRQVRGLTQASKNAQDGISMVQTAEGALNEVHDMLHRMNELCVKAANDTNTSEDRIAIQEEIDQLTEQIDHIGDSTEFNTIRVLAGLPQPKATAVNAAVTVNGAAGVVTQATSSADATYKIKALTTGDSGDVVSIKNPGTKYYKAADEADFQAYNKAWSDYNKYVADNKPWEKYDEEMAHYDPSSGDPAPQPPGYPRPQPVAQPINRDGSTSAKAKLTSVADIKREIANVLLKSNAEANADIADSVSVEYSKGSNDGEFSLHFYGSLPVSLQVGTEKDQTVDFKIKVINAGALGIYGVDVRGKDGSGAREGIDIVKEAIAKTSEERSKLGAIQNRLEHTIKNLDNVVENTAAAESAIRDADMATEAMNNAKSNILEQAGIAMLSQANQQRQGILTLLQ